MLIKRVKDFYNNHPIIWLSAVNRYLQQDEENQPPARAVLFTGSSTIRFWDTLTQDLAPFPVINRGFGGAMLHQVVHYMDQIVLPYRPAAIFLYAGENDIAGLLLTRRHPAEDVFESFREFCRRVHEQLPDTSVHYIAIKPPRRRRKYWPEMQRANRMIENFCAGDPRLYYIDIVPALQDATGATRGELFRRDGVHLNAAGYAVLTRVIRPAVAALFAGEAATSPTR